jgi:hypothetical protein
MILPNLQLDMLGMVNNYTVFPFVVNFAVHNVAILFSAITDCVLHVIQVFRDIDMLPVASELLVVQLYPVLYTHHHY